jgi:uncharacterized protein (TIGR00251 family)
MAVILEIKVVPQAGKQSITRDKTGTIKCHLKSPPEDGKANAELIKFLAKSLKIAQESIKILQGATSRKKVLKIDTLQTLDAVLHTLGIEVQTTI